MKSQVGGQALRGRSLFWSAQNMHYKNIPKEKITLFFTGAGMLNWTHWFLSEESKISFVLIRSALNQSMYCPCFWDVNQTAKHTDKKEMHGKAIKVFWSIFVQLSYNHVDLKWNNCLRGIHTFCGLATNLLEVSLVHCRSGITTVGFIAAEIRCISMCLFSLPAIKTTDYFISFT